MQSKNPIELFKDNKDFALQLALRDALVDGIGFVTVDSDGNVTYVDIEEVQEIVNEINRNR